MKPEEGADGIAYAFLDENWGQPGVKRKAAVSVVEGEHRFVAGTDISGQPFEALLSSEDGEVENRIADEPEIADRLRAEAVRLLKSRPAFESETLELDELQLDQLRALSYDLP